MRDMSYTTSKASAKCADTLKQRMVARTASARRRTLPISDLPMKSNTPISDARPMQSEPQVRCIGIVVRHRGTSPRVNARVRQVAPGKKNRTFATPAESGPDKWVLASSCGLMSQMTHNDQALRPKV